MNEAANEQDHKKPPALGTNQIAGFGGFRPLAKKLKQCNNHNKKTRKFQLPEIHFQCS